MLMVHRARRLVVATRTDSRHAPRIRIRRCPRARQNFAESYRRSSRRPGTVCRRSHARYWRAAGAASRGIAFQREERLAQSFDVVDMVQERSEPLFLILSCDPRTHSSARCAPPGLCFRSTLRWVRSKVAIAEEAPRVCRPFAPTC